MKKKVYSLVTFLGLFIIPNLQSQIIYSEDFSNGIPEIWENVDLNPDGDDVFWSVCNYSQTCPPESPPFSSPPFSSPTASNGYAFSEPFGDGGFDSRLTTQSIDCSAFSNVYILFHTQIGTLGSNARDHARLRVSVGGGPWEAFTIFPSYTDQSLFFPDFSEVISLDLTEIAADESDVRIQWRWESNSGGYWLIDDFQLTASDPAKPENTCFFERFNGGMEGWSSNALEGDSTWKWHPNGDVTEALSVNDDEPLHIRSISAVDGAVTFNADYYTSGGNTPDPTPPYYTCELISPTIDLSGETEPLFLRFSQLAQFLNPAPLAPADENGKRLITSFQISTNNGQTWGPPVDINPFLIPNTYPLFIPPANDTRIFPLPQIQGELEVKVKFTWAGDLYYWVLDDIAIAKRPPYDMETQRNFYARMPNALTPISQLDSLGESFMADILNVGGETATGVTQSLGIGHNATGTLVYSDTNEIGEVELDELIENVIFEEKLYPQDLPYKGMYTGFYSVAQDSTDARPSNDSIFWNFEITDTTFAKEFDFDRSITAAQNADYTYGNVFFTPYGQGFYARYMTFGVANASSLAGQTVNTFVYGFQADHNNDEIINIDNDPDVTLMAFNSYTFTGEEDAQPITIPVSFEEVGVALQDSTYYLVAVRYDEEGSGDRCFFLAGQSVPYHGTWFVTDSLDRPRYASALDIGNTNSYSLVGFGLDIVPYVRLHIGCTPDLSESPLGDMVGTVAPLALRKFDLYPNPVKDQCTADISLEKLTENMLVRITDVSGRTVYTETLTNIYEKKLSFNTTLWQSGIYFLELRTAEGIATKRLIVQKR